MDIYKVMGVALIGVILNILFKQYKPEYALFVSIATGTIIFTYVITALMPAFDSINQILTAYKSSSIYIMAILKTLGICYISSFIADCCIDCGQTVIAGKVNLAGKVSIVVISLPLFDNIIQLAVSLLNKG